MTTKWFALSAAALLLTASACSNGAKPSAEQPAPATTPAPSAATSQPESKSGAETAAPAPAAETKQQLAKPEKAEATKQYTMNPKTYDIVPLDQTSAPKNVVLLTFDDGPKDLELNQKLLDTLDKHKAKAIFFLNGYRVKQKPELVKLIHERGQTVGNHSWDHIDLKKESKEKVAQQIGDVQKAVKGITGEAPVFFRPPFGSGGDIVKGIAKDEKLLFMTWSNGSKDWEMTVKNNNPDQVIKNVLDQLRPGSNILMHELSWTAQALDSLLTQLEAKGYGFVDPATIDIKF